jgi:RNA polymerase sigma factor (sigma-70 family)
MANVPTPRRDPQANAHLADFLARECRGFLCAVARRAGADEDSIDDVVQGALLDVLRSFPGPDEKGHVAAYAARCVQGRVWKLQRRHSRKEGRNRALPEFVATDRLGTSIEIAIGDPSAPESDELVEAAEGLAAKRELLMQLPEEQRAALLLSAAGFGTEEIAERLALSPRAVRKRVEKANRRLRDLKEGAQ